MKTYTYPEGKVTVGRIGVADPYDGCVLRNVTDRIIRSDNQYVYEQGETCCMTIMCRSEEDRNDVVRILTTLDTLGIEYETDFDF